MNSRVKAYIDGLFAGVTLEGEAAELHEELCANCTERYDDLLSQGYSADEAFELVREGMGDMDELLAPYRRKAQGETDEARMESETVPYFEQAFDVTGVTGLEVCTRNESLRVIPNSGEELVVIYERDGDANFDPPRITCEDGTLRIETVRYENIAFTLQKGTTLQSILRALKNKGDARLTLCVPQGMMPDLRVNGASGSLRVEGVALRGADVHLASGSIRMETDMRVRGETYALRTSSGSIKCSAAANRIILNTTSGSVKAACDTPVLQAHALSGSVRAEGAIGEMEAKSVSGSVHVRITNADVRSVQAHAVSGSVHIAVPASIPGFTLSASSARGGLHNAFGSPVFGDASVRICATTASGSVHLDRIDG